MKRASVYRSFSRLCSVEFSATWRSTSITSGFYGRPWTTEDRKRLFHRMNKMGMNTYVYAPKDDCKHRVYWRELYSVEEAEHLTGLINAAKENNVIFVYAISPGLDITFSSSKEVTLLKRKIEQVASFGCSAFALLFDDIEADMSEADKEIFQSFAQAQVSVTNEVYQHLSQPATFLFCPTEYCASRALPDVPSSEYLNTIGSKLLPGIDVLWTGPKVISKKISVKSIIEVTKVLKRPPLIWDNIHANDYDPKRVFMGPYAGRSPELIPYIRGVVTNPNCEFEANFVALHTLAQWCRSNVDGVKKDLPLEGSHSPVRADIQLEIEGECGSDEEISDIYDSRYQPQQALAAAIKDWLPEFDLAHQVLTRTKPLTLSTQTQPVVQTCGAVTGTTPTQATGLVSTPGVVSTPSLSLPQVDLEVNQSFMQPAMAATPMNSLVDPSSSDSESEAGGEIAEPMDTLPTPGSTPPGPTILHPPSLPFTSCDSSSETSITPIKALEGMQVEPALSTQAQHSTSTAGDHSSLDDQVSKTDLTYDEVVLLVSLFYLPFEYGSSALTFLNEFEWLKTNAYVVTDGKRKNAEPEQKEAAREWKRRADEFERNVEAVHCMADKFRQIPNKVLLFNLFPYIWDVRGALSIMSAFIKWLGQGCMPYVSQCNLQSRQHSWASPVYREAFTNGKQEPWVFQGGLQAELKRMLPVECTSDLLFCPLLPKVPSIDFCSVRPYKPSDEAGVYEVCLRTCDDGMDGTDIFADHPELIGDRFAGPFLTVSPEFCFVLEGQGKILGYCLATDNAKVFHSKVALSWTASMQKKYPQPEKEKILSPAEEMINSWYGEHLQLPESVFGHFPALVRLNVLPCIHEDYSATKRLLLTAVAALRTKGCQGFHCEVHVGDKNIQEAYKHLGLCEIPLEEQYSDDILLYGRAV